MLGMVRGLVTLTHVKVVSILNLIRAHSSCENDQSGIVAIFNWGLTDLVLLCFRVVQWKSYLSCI